MIIDIIYGMIHSTHLRIEKVIVRTDCTWFIGIVICSCVVIFLHVHGYCFKMVWSVICADVTDFI